MNKKLILKDGTVYLGNSFGYDKETYTEIVFNTGMSGYQETISDNSYYGQAICFTSPLIGNYGINKDDFEGAKSVCDGVIVKNYCDAPSHFKGEISLDQHLKASMVVGICDVDTRSLTRHIRDYGSMACAIVDIDKDEKAVLKKLTTFKVVDHVKNVSSKQVTHYLKGKQKILVIDFGAKKNIIDNLISSDFTTIVVGHDTTYDEIESYNPDGILLSNGPGDPRDLPDVVELIKKLQKKYVMFGICLGHQLICLANGCEIEKLKFGHRGCNHPVKNLKTDKIEITSQNHSYVVKNIASELKITHINIHDNTIEGIEHKRDNIFSVQYHPESCPGPNDSNYLFEEFYSKIKKENDAKNK